MATDTKSANTLVIVESPTKAKTISRFLGASYDVQASMGHVRDLPKSKIGIDVEHNFEPTYLVPVKAKEVVAELKRKAKSAHSVILATDEDREGEAIAWHLAETLDLSKHPNKKVERIVFHEITKSAIEEAITHPRTIDMRLVDAQQARRVLDRLVGYELSPFLWRKIRYGLSAGRVQSVAVRLVVEREREIERFNKEEYWTIETTLLKGKTEFPARLFAIDKKTLDKFAITTRKEAEAIAADLKGKTLQVTEVIKKELSRTPAPPFTTSTLQQEAARKLGFSAKQTMVIAQQLYEHGHITYMRTDSVNLAASALTEARKVVAAEFGTNYTLETPRAYQTKSKGAQEAHEAIRPTHLSLTPKEVGFSDRGQVKLYELIWKRTIATQMQAARVEQTSAHIETSEGKYTLRASGQVILFDGFMRVYTEGRDEKEEEESGTLPALLKGDAIKEKEVLPVQHFTEPPPRYTDATLVKALEAHGVGRPSTYAPTLSTIQDRGYVEKEDKKYKPTEIGVIVNDMLVEHFPEIVDINFTSHIEEELDQIAEGNLKWVEVMREFYDPFKTHLKEKELEVEKKIQISTTPCPHCGKMMVIKFGRMGKFLACPDPEVKVTLPMPEEAAMIKAFEEKTKDERCPICEKPMEVKRGRFGFFLGCSDYPKCKGVSKIWNKTGFKCPNCLGTPERKEKPGDIVEKKGRGRGKPFYACTRFPDCTFVTNKKPESEAELQAAFEYWKANPPKPREKKYSKKKTA